MSNIPTTIIPSASGFPARNRRAISSVWLYGKEKENLFNISEGRGVEVQERVERS